MGLKEERLFIKKLQESGLSIKEINEIFNDKSHEWISDRLVSRKEIIYQKEVIIPELINNGHKIIKECFRFRYNNLTLEIDILSKYEGILYFSEVKSTLKGHSLHTAIGQLILHYIFNNKDVNIKYQIILPFKYENEVDLELINLLELYADISIVFY